MFVFVWESTSISACQAEAFHNFDDAWERFRDLKIKQFPDHIVQINSPDEGVVSPMTWREFVDFHPAAMSS